VDVEPRFRETGECGCGCGAYGSLKKKWSDGSRCVARKCSCARCRGRNSRSKGDGKARKARAALAIPGVNSRHEEHTGGTVRWEAKAGAQIQPMWTAFRKAEAQSEAARPVGDNRPFVMTAAPDGESDQIVAFRLSKVREVTAALAEQLGIIEWP
jgi:hypothetical protein